MPVISCVEHLHQFHDTLPFAEVASVTYIECTIRKLDNINPEKPIDRLRAFDAWQLLSVIQAIQNTLHVACHEQA